MSNPLPSEDIIASIVSKLHELNLTSHEEGADENERETNLSGLKIDMWGGETGVTLGIFQPEWKDWDWLVKIPFEEVIADQCAHILQQDDVAFGRELYVDLVAAASRVEAAISAADKARAKEDQAK